MNSSRTIFKKLLDVDEALNLVFNKLGYSLLNKILSETEYVNIYDLGGRLIAEDIKASRPLPWYPRSLVDGCAVMSIDVQGAFEDRPILLKRLGRVKIGEKPRGTIAQGACMEVDTGAWIPPGADAIVPVEYYDIIGDNVMIKRAVVPGNGVAMPASDVADGDIIITKGTPINSYMAGVLGSLGIRNVKASRKIRVGVLSTGDELIEPGTFLSDLQDPRIFDSNRPYLINEIKELGWKPIDLGIVNDNEKEIENVIVEAIDKYNVDIILSSGGTSAGVEDYVYRVAKKLGEVLLHGLRLKPGKPTVVGVIDKTLLIGLPGNPRSCINVMNKFVKPLLTLLGLIWPKESIRTIKSKLMVSLSGEKGRTTFIPVALIGNILVNDKVYALPVAKDSYMIASLPMSDGYVTLSAHQARPLRPFEDVYVELNRFSPCTLLVLVDTPIEYVENSVRFVRDLCGYVKNVIAPLSTKEQVFLPEGLFVLTSKTSSSLNNTNYEILKEFDENIILLKKTKEVCKRIAVPSFLDIYIEKLKKMGSINQNTIIIPVPRSSSALILYKANYVDCALIVSDLKEYKEAEALNEVVGKERLLLARIKGH